MRRPYNLIFISAEHKTRSDVRNDESTQRLGAMITLLGFNNTKVQGKYEGRPEASYMMQVFPPGEDALPIARYLAFSVFSQDSILLIDTQDGATLLFQDGSEKFIGIWTEIRIDDIRDETDYSYVGGRYFTVM